MRVLVIVLVAVVSCCMRVGMRVVLMRMTVGMAVAVRGRLWARRSGWAMTMAVTMSV